MVYNIHSLVHLADDAAKFGSLNECSAFCFENYMQKLKKFVRSGNRPIAQIVKRLDETTRERKRTENRDKVKEIQNLYPNKAYLMTDNSCCEVLSLNNLDRTNNSQVLCRVYNKTLPFVTHPCDSRVVGCFKVSNN